MSLSPEELLTRLTNAPEHRYPGDIVTEIISRRDEMTPVLLAVLEEAAADPEKYIAGDSRWRTLIFAAFVLAQGRETRAFRPICATLNLQEEIADDLWGDMITEDLGRVLASVYDGDDAPLRFIMANADAHQYIRGATVPQAYACLVQGGRMQRDELEARAAEILGGGLERTYSFAWDGWLGLCADFGFTALAPLVREALDEDLCDPFFEEPERILSAVTSGQTKALPYRTGLIDDVIADTEWWACWNQSEESDLSPPPPGSPHVIPARSAKIGRNAACPCGSGKKYKKCCGVA